ncbi:hypothetical protein EDE15_3519 [Edaphobacter aggregans]|uniref:Uncharacterized protein n=1 Tax=Edaphobacter aggregans TaxID=570835 RepID=A0A428MM26_9BACT|nr:hypothetical protein [Edaphobacter aggregans]RSL17967.1 hypothetical protein EDE15_3519 [Edaphobacter aggregans]
MFESATPKKKGPKYLNRLRVTENFISSYIDLSESDRGYVEGFLALQVYGDAGMGHYTPGRNRRHVKSADPNVLCECIKMAFDEPWSTWAKMITRANLWEFERREAVREMLGALNSPEYKDCIEAIASHKDRKEITKRCVTLLSKERVEQ